MAFYDHQGHRLEEIAESPALPDLALPDPAPMADRLSLLLNTYYHTFHPKSASIFVGVYPADNPSNFGYDFRVLPTD
jgi:hypothetical protein